MTNRVPNTATRRTVLARSSLARGSKISTIGSGEMAMSPECRSEELPQVWQQYPPRRPSAGVCSRQDTQPIQCDHQLGRAQIPGMSPHGLLPCPVCGLGSRAPWPISRSNERWLQLQARPPNPSSDRSSSDHASAFDGLNQIMRLLPCLVPQFAQDFRWVLNHDCRMPLHKTHVQASEPGDRMWPRKNYIDLDCNEKSQMARRLIVMKLVLDQSPRMHLSKVFAPIHLQFKLPAQIFRGYSL